VTAGDVRAGHRLPRYLAFEPRPRAAARLYCFPYAGGAATVYRQWQGVVPPDLELRSCQPPGRQDRLDEPAVTDASALAALLADDLQDEGDDRPFALFGHSMGALIAYELARELQRRGAAMPAVVAVSGRSSPLATGPRTHLHLLPTPDLLSALAHLGGLPREVLAVPELMELLLPTLRADLELAETHRPAAAREPLGCPLVVFGGADDPLVDVGGLPAWQECSRHPISVRVFPGDHFFLWPVGAELIRTIASRLPHRAARPVEPQVERSAGGEVPPA